MYKNRFARLKTALENYREKENYKFAKDAISFSYSPEEGVDPWNSWSVLPWEFDPYKYRTLRRSVATLCRLVRKKSITPSRFMYYLDNLEHQEELISLPFWQSNELSSSHPFGGYIYSTILDEAETPVKFTFIPFVYFAILRFWLLNFYRYRKIPNKGNIPWGIDEGFLRIPSRIWKLEEHPGMLLYVWDLPGAFANRWSFRENAAYVGGKLHLYKRPRWFKGFEVIENKLWSPEKDAEIHRQFLQTLDELKITKESSPGKKRFFIEWFLSLRHAPYEYFAAEMPRIFRVKFYFVLNHVRRTFYAKQDGDFVRLLIYSLYFRLQLDLDHTDRMLNFVSWLDFLNWEGTFWPFSYNYVRACGDNLDTVRRKVYISLSIPNFSSVRKTFISKK